MPLHRITEPGFELREQECIEGDNGRAIHPPVPAVAEIVRSTLLTLLLAITFAGRHGAGQPAYTPERTPEGAPSLEGIWQPQTSGAAYSILPHPPGFLLGAGSKTGVVEGGVLPYQPWAAEQVKYRLDHMELDPTGHCHYEGIPHAMYFAFQIFQTPKEIAVVHENMHAWRIIHMEGQHPKDYLAWMGDSRGHWEGNTLVVDVANNNDKSVFDMAGHFHTDALHVVERFTPLDADTIPTRRRWTIPKRSPAR